MHYNDYLDLIEYFGIPDVKPVTVQEFDEFWDSLTLQEMRYYHNVDLATGRISKFA